MAQRDHYEILGVTRTATQDEIKIAFRKLALAASSGQEPGRRRGGRALQGDQRVLPGAERSASAARCTTASVIAPRTPASPFGQSGPFAGGVVDISDIAIDGILGDLLGVFGVGKRRQGRHSSASSRSPSRRPRSAAKKSSRYHQIVDCSDCHGTGSAPGSRPEGCTACNGRGRVRFQQGILPIAVERVCSRCRGTRPRRHRSVPRLPRQRPDEARARRSRSRSPPGVEPGATRIVDRRRQPPAPRPRRPAISKLVIQVAAAPVLQARRRRRHLPRADHVHAGRARRRGRGPDARRQGQAARPAGTQPGTMLRIKGKGIPHRTGIGRGDQRVEVTIEVPTPLTEAPARAARGAREGARRGGPAAAPHVHGEAEGPLRLITGRRSAVGSAA